MSRDGEYPPGYGGGLSYSINYGDQVARGGARLPAHEASAADRARVLHNVECEAALLGGLMIANNFIPIIAERVSEEHFFEPVHGRIFRAIIKMHERGKQANPVLLRPIFENDPDIKELGGPAYLAMLTGSGASIVGLVDFADQVAELAIRRQVAASFETALERICAGDADSGIEEIDDLVAEIADTAALATTIAQPMKPTSMRESVLRVRDRAIDITENDAVVGNSCRSIPDIDDIIGRLEPGYHVIAGRPGMLKTTLAMTAAWGYAADGLPGVYFAGEMTQEQIDLRKAADLSEAMGIPISHEALKKGALSSKHIADLDSIAQMVETMPLEFYTTGACDIRRLDAALARAILRWNKKGRRLGFFVVDYIQKFGATDARGRPITDEGERVTAVSRTINRMCQRYGVAGIALSQLSRKVEERKDKRPQIDDLKLSGTIEEDADTVSLLFREEFYMAKERPKKQEGDAYEKWRTDFEIVRGKVELIGEKNRHGRQRTKTLRFLHPYYAIRSGSYEEIGPNLLGEDLFAERDGADIL